MINSVSTYDSYKVPYQIFGLETEILRLVHFFFSLKITARKGFIRTGSLTGIADALDLSIATFKRLLYKAINYKWIVRDFNRSGEHIGYRLISYSTLFNRFDFYKTKRKHVSHTFFFRLNHLKFKNFQKALIAFAIENKHKQFNYAFQNSAVNLNEVAKTSKMKATSSTNSINESGFAISMRKLSESLNMSAATVSRLIKSMEKDENIKWFDRIERSNEFIADATYDEYLEYIKGNADRDCIFFDGNSIYKRNCNKYYLNKINSVAEVQEDNINNCEVGPATDLVIVQPEEQPKPTINNTVTEFKMSNENPFYEEVTERYEIAQLINKYPNAKFIVEGEKVKIYKDKTSSIFQRFSLNDLNLAEDFYLRKLEVPAAHGTQPTNAQRIEAELAIANLFKF